MWGEWHPHYVRHSHDVVENFTRIQNTNCVFFRVRSRNFCKSVIQLLAGWEATVFNQFSLHRDNNRSTNVENYSSSVHIVAWSVKLTWKLLKTNSSDIETTQEAKELRSLNAINIRAYLSLFCMTLTLFFLSFSTISNYSNFMFLHYMYAFDSLR